MHRIGLRRLTQIVSAVLYNAHITGFRDGTLYTGALKYACVPGLNCYSCPGSVASCPLGSLQNALRTGPVRVPLYALGLILLFGVLLGRTVCSFLCPFGLLQELLYKVPVRKLKKGRVTRRLSGLKYVVLILFGLLLPLYTGAPSFCAWICPAGTLEGGLFHVLYTPALRAMLGGVFWWKASLAAMILALCLFLFRPFCRFLCPLGALYGLLNPVAAAGVRCDESACIHCGKCVEHCGMDVRHINDRECIRCGECADVCPVNAISPHSFSWRKRK